MFFNSKIGEEFNKIIKSDIKLHFCLLNSIFLKKISLIILKLELKSLIKPSKIFPMQFSLLWWPLYGSYGTSSQFWGSYCHIARKNYVLKKLFFQIFEKIFKNMKIKYFILILDSIKCPVCLKMISCIRNQLYKLAFSNCV